MFLFSFSFFSCKKIGVCCWCWLAHFCVFARAFIAVGNAWPKHPLAVCAMCTRYLCLVVCDHVITELVSMRHQHGYWLYRM